MQLMQEEIFGPVLPVVSYERLDDAITHINARATPVGAVLVWAERGGARRRCCSAPSVVV